MEKLIPTTTLIYLIKDNKYLFLLRNKEENDFNKGLYLGIGGHKEENETIKQCLVREVKEETNLDLINYKFRGIIEFESNDYKEIMYLYTSSSFKGNLGKCSEGDLVWVDKNDIFNLNIYEGDKYFLTDIFNDLDNINYKFIYDGHKLIKVIKK